MLIVSLYISKVSFTMHPLIIPIINFQGRVSQHRYIPCSLRDEDENFLYIWIILLTMRIWGTLRYYAVFTACDALLPDLSAISTLDTVFQYFQSVGDSSMAFCNFVVFTLCDTAIRKWLASFICYRRISKTNEHMNLIS